MEFRRTPTKKWLKQLNLEHLSEFFEINGFQTVGALSAMDLADIDVIFQPNGLKLGERRLLEKQIKMLQTKVIFIFSSLIVFFKFHKYLLMCNNKIGQHNFYSFNL